MAEELAQRGQQAGTEPGAEVGGESPGAVGLGERRPKLDGQPTTAAAEPASEDLTALDELRHDVRFAALRNAFYHSARLRFYEWQHRALMFAIVLFGTGGVANLFDKNGGSQWLAGVTALLATLDLVLDLRGKAQLHDALKRRYYLLLAKLDESPDAGERQLRRWHARIMQITADEPVTFRAVDAVAHNEATDTMGLDSGKKQVLTRHQYRWRNLCTYQGVTFPYAEESEKN